MSQFESPFLAVPAGDWLCSNDLAFAIFDGFPVSPGHVLVTTRRIVETWFDATDEEQAALMALVKEAKRLLDLQLAPNPDGYNVGFNSGGAAGQTVPHVHIHVIPRYHGDSIPDTAEPATDELPGFIETPAAKDQFTRLVPVYSLQAAAGLWGPESSPEEIGWAAPAGVSIKPGMFIARVRGHSMEPKIRDGSWNLFRPCPQSSREGRIVHVQFNSMGDPENGGRFTVKKYHSRKTLTNDTWQHDQIQLLPLNPACDPIPVAPHEGPELMVIGEWVASID
ncbi:MAG: HIT domain-containing protein [Luteolibacter sp.]